MDGPIHFHKWTELLSINNQWRKGPICSTAPCLSSGVHTTAEILIYSCVSILFQKFSVRPSVFGFIWCGIPEYLGYFTNLSQGYRRTLPRESFNNERVLKVNNCSSANSRLLRSLTNYPRWRMATGCFTFRVTAEHIWVFAKTVVDSFIDLCIKDILCLIRHVLNFKFRT